MNEENILDKILELMENCDCWLENENTPQEEIAWFQTEKSAIQDLLDLYKQEKEKNNKAINYIERLEVNSIGTLFTYTAPGKELLKILKGE